MSRVYYQSPWYGLNFEVRAGQYLAGDRGVTVEVTRRFSTGVEIGASLQNQCLGGPVRRGQLRQGHHRAHSAGMGPAHRTQGEYGIDLRPVQRDGGQTLGGDATLYDETFRTGEGEIDSHVDTFIAP